MCIRGSSPVWDVTMGPKIPKHLVEQYAAAFKEHERLKSVSGIVHGVRFFFNLYPKDV